MFFYDALKKLQEQPQGMVKVRRRYAPTGTCIMRVSTKKFDDVLVVADLNGYMIEPYTPTQSDLLAYDWDLA